MFFIVTSMLFLLNHIAYAEVYITDLRGCGNSPEIQVMGEGSSDTIRITTQTLVGQRRPIPVVHILGENNTVLNHRSLTDCRGSFNEQESVRFESPFKAGHHIASIT